MILALLIIISPLAYAEEVGANSDQVIFIHYQDESVAVQEVKAGNLDAYFWRIPLELISDLRDDPNVKLYETPGGRLSILLNPAPSDDGLNPFSIKEVRYAMNYLIDRELIVNEILKGAAAVSYSAFSQFDPDYIVLVDIIESFGFRYNPTLADSMITKALEENGAVKKDGKWYYNDQPITLKFFIRNDDPRRNSIGKVLSSELEKLGFTIEEINGDLNKALTSVYGSDPKDFEWHIYTEGWGSSAFDRYDSSLAAQMYAPWFGAMPGFQNEGFWNYQNQTIDDLTIKIFTGNYTSKDERDQLLRESVKIGVDESVRIFIASTLDPYVINSNTLDGVIADFGAGITSRFSLINARSDDNVIKVGMKQIYQGSWNPVGGLRDWYSTRVWLAVADPAIFRHPHTGDILPVRATWQVDTAGPNNKLVVPSDAFIWNASSNEWSNVGDGVEATSKVTFDLKYSNWHHGAPMDKNDILYSIYFLYEWSSDDDQTFDPEYAAVAQQFANTLKGFKFIDDDTIEVYVDYWHFDENYIADYASIWSSTPWEIYAAMEDVVVNNKAAFSRSEASANNVNWLSLLIKEDSLLIKEALEKFRDENFIPAPLDVDIAYASDRYTKAIDWIDAKEHAVISNGPFYLDSYNPDARTITIKAFRDSTYPFEADYWKEFENLKVAEIANLDVPLSLNRGETTTIKGSINYDGDYNDVSIFYFLKDGNGDVVVKGDTTANADGSFNIELSSRDTAKLSEGSNELKVMSISNKALKPDIRSISLIAVGSAMEFKEVTINDNTFEIGVASGEIRGIEVDEENKSIILSIDVSEDGMLEVNLPRELIDAREDGNDKPFIVMVDDNMVEVQEDVNENARILKIPVSADSKEIRITGTQVVPEFGIIAMLILTLGIGSLLIARRLNLTI